MSYSKTHKLVCVSGLSLNATNTDTPVYVPFARFQVTGMKISNASTTLAGSSATLGLYTAPAAGGTALVTPAVMTGLTSADIVQSSTLASTALTTGTVGTNGNAGMNFLYIRNAVTHGAAATVTVEIEITRWP
jgi:hypothetical protein